MTTDAPIEPSKPDFLIRIQLTDGSIESFVPADAAEARRIWEEIEPSRLFTHPRLILAGEHSKSVFVSSQIVRLDFVQQTYKCWEFPGGYSDVVELSEAEFIEHAHLGQPSLMAKRKSQTPVGDLLVSFLKLHMTGGRPVFLMAELPVKLPADSQSFMQFLLAGGGFHIRLPEGGMGIINLAHLAGYSVYPGVAQVPASTWLTEPVSNELPNL
jgi:hypothetical protein